MSQQSDAYVANFTLPSAENQAAVEAFHDFCEEWDVVWESERGFISVLTEDGWEALYETGVIGIDAEGHTHILFEGDKLTAF